jgi:hypothetical protein
MWWRTELTNVAKLGDELWQGEKFQSNLEIAGSPRNVFRYSLEFEVTEGRALNRLGGVKLTKPNQTPNVSNCARE